MDIFLGGLGGATMTSYSTTSSGGGRSGSGPTNATLQNDVRDLTHQIQRLSLLNQALWELLSEKYGIAEEELAGKIREVDMRDGVDDGRMTDTAMRCPKCDRVSNSKHYRCLYCGVTFKRPIMG